MQSFLQLIPRLGIFGVEIKISYLRIITILLALLVYCRALLAQDALQYSFTHYSVNSGLAAYNTTNAVQDDQGYMWIGTINGLQCSQSISRLLPHNGTSTVLPGASCKLCQN